MNDITPAEFERLERERIAREAPFDRLLDALCVLFFVGLAARLIYAQFWQHVNVIGAVVQYDRNIGSGFAMLLQPTWFDAAFWIGYILILFSPMILDSFGYLITRLTKRRLK